MGFGEDVQSEEGVGEGLVTFFPIHSSLHVGGRAAGCSVRLIGRGIRDPIERDWAQASIRMHHAHLSLSILLNSISHPDERERLILSWETKRLFENQSTNQWTNFFMNSFHFLFFFAKNMPPVAVTIDF